MNKSDILVDYKSFWIFLINKNFLFHFFPMTELILMAFSQSFDQLL